jgi:predicted HTH transcriptional regulator
MSRPYNKVTGQPDPQKLNPIQRMIIGGENELLDFKKEISSKSKIAKTIVSFANHKGGRLLVGVNDNKTLHGVSSEEEKFMLQEAAQFYCRPEINLTIREWLIKGKVILEVIIPEGDDKPYYAKDEQGKWWVHIRVKDQSLLASKIVVDVLKKNRHESKTLIQYGEKEQALFSYLHKNERITLKQYCKLLNISRQRAARILVNLVSVGIIRLHSTEKTDFFTLS